MQKRGELLDDVFSSLDLFLVSTNKFDTWLADFNEKVGAKDLSKINIDEFIAGVESAGRERDRKKEEFDEIIRSGKSLVAKKDVTDTTSIKDRIKVLRLSR